MQEETERDRHTMDFMPCYASEGFRRACVSVRACVCVRVPLAKILVSTSLSSQPGARTSETNKDSFVQIQLTGQFTQNNNNKKELKPTKSPDFLYPSSHADLCYLWSWLNWPNH